MMHTACYCINVLLYCTQHGQQIVHSFEGFSIWILWYPQVLYNITKKTSSSQR